MNRTMKACLIPHIRDHKCNAAICVCVRARQCVHEEPVLGHYRVLFHWRNPEILA
jgi:hypothetical protein